MEAAHQGLPIVSTHAAAIGEFIEDGVNGLLVSPGAPDELAAALARLNRVLVPNTKVLIVAIGMNDFKLRRPIAEITSNIGKIIRQAKARGIEVLLCGFKEELYGPPYDVQFKDMYTALQTQYGVEMVPDLMQVSTATDLVTQRLPQIHVA